MTYFSISLFLLFLIGVPFSFFLFSLLGVSFCVLERRGLVVGWGFLGVGVSLLGSTYRMGDDSRGFVLSCLVVVVVVVVELLCHEVYCTSALLCLLVCGCDRPL